MSAAHRAQLLADGEYVKTGPYVPKGMGLFQFITSLPDSEVSECPGCPACDVEHFWRSASRAQKLRAFWAESQGDCA